MSARLRNLLEQRNRIVTRAREIMEGAEREERALNAEEQKNFNAALDEQDEIRKQIESAERLALIEGELASSRGTQLNGNTEQRSGRNTGAGDGKPAALRSIGEGRYQVLLDGLSDDELRTVERRSTQEYRAGFTSYVRTGEVRALDAGSTGQNGAFLVTPMQMALSILQALDDAVFIRGLASQFSIPTSTSLGRVSLDNDADDADWTTELATGNEETGLAFGKRELTPHPMAKLIKLSNKLLRQSFTNVEALAVQRIAYKVGLTEEKAFLTGNGVQKPLGVYVASTDGIPTSRDIATGNTSTAITFEGIINAKYALKSGYLKNARWLFGRTGVKQVALIREDSGAGAGTGAFLWQPSQQLGEPDRIHGIPVMMSEYNPSTFTSGQYVGMLADWSFYHIADALDMQIQRLGELFALTNQTGLVIRKETDGMPVLSEAFVRVKLG